MVNYCDLYSVAEPELVLFGRSQCKGPASAPPYIKQKKF